MRNSSIDFRFSPHVAHAVSINTVLTFLVHSKLPGLSCCLSSGNYILNKYHKEGKYSSEIQRHIEFKHRTSILQLISPLADPTTGTTRYMTETNS